MNPFDPDYKPKADMTSVARHSEASRRSARTRARMLEHGSPEAKFAASGYLGPLSEKSVDLRAKIKPSNL